MAVRGGTAYAAPDRPGRSATRSVPPPPRSPRPRPAGSGWSSRPATPTAGSACARSRSAARPDRPRWCRGAACRSTGGRWPGCPAACWWTWSGLAGGWASGAPGQAGSAWRCGRPHRSWWRPAAPRWPGSRGRPSTSATWPAAGPGWCRPRRQREVRARRGLLARWAGAGRRHPGWRLDPSRAGPGQGRQGRGGAGGRVGGALSDRCSPCLAWARTGDWVFFNRLGPGFGIGAYRLDHPPAATVPLDVPGSFPPSLQTI